MYVGVDERGATSERYVSAFSRGEYSSRSLPIGTFEERTSCPVPSMCSLLDSALDERFDRLARLACRLYEADVAILSLVDGCHRWQNARTSNLAPFSVAQGDAICRAIVASGAPLVIGDMASAPRGARPPVAPQPEPCFCAGVPLLAGPGLVIGSLCVMAREARDLAAVDLGPLHDLAAVAADEAELLRLNLDLAHKSQVDPLTGLANRRSFDEAMERAVCRAERLGGPLSLLMVDIDHFKVVNDLWGHQAGDTVLAAVGGVLARQPRRPVDLIARYGGEEFAVILPDTDEAGCDALAAALLKALRNANIRHPYGMAVTASIGGATARGRGLAEVFASADAALYEAKACGRAHYRRGDVARSASRRLSRA